jgi:hypothetical protein
VPAVHAPVAVGAENTTPNNTKPNKEFKTAKTAKPVNTGKVTTPVTSESTTIISDSSRPLNAALTDKIATANARRDSAVATRDAAMLSLSNAVAERDAALAERDMLSAERDGALEEKDAAVAARDAALAKKTKAVDLAEGRVAAVKMWESLAGQLRVEREKAVAQAAAGALRLEGHYIEMEAAEKEAAIAIDEAKAAAAQATALAHKRRPNLFASAARAVACAALGAFVAGRANRH